MKLFLWSGFPGKQSIQGIALAAEIDQARAQIIASLNPGHYPDLIEFINQHDPVVHGSPTGWLQEIGAQYL